MAALAARSWRGPVGKKVVLLNFPNNPSGYTPTVAEAKAIVACLTAEAARGSAVVVLIDDAYFGLVFEDGVIGESIFVDLADAHPNLLAVKIDGATKEDYVWGFRVGFLTYRHQGRHAGALRGARGEDRRRDSRQHQQFAEPGAVGAGARLEVGRVRRREGREVRPASHALPDRAPGARRAPGVRRAVRAPCRSTLATSCA